MEIFSAFNKRVLKPVGILKNKSSIRRSRFFDRQNKERRTQHELIREKALEALYDFDAQRLTEDWKHQVFPKKVPSSNISKSVTSKIRSSAAEYLSSLLMFPDYMVDVPEALASEWLAFQWLEGDRVFLVSEGGSCCLFRKNGDFIQSFKTDLPASGCTILDGILVKVEYDSVQKYVQVIDCLSWNDCSYVDSSTECRRFLLESRFAELETRISQVTRTNEIRLKLINMVNATPDNLHKLYIHRDVEIMPNGIAFIHKEAFYTPGLSQLYLIFRDNVISLWCIPTMDKERKSFPEFQENILKLRLQTGHVLTEDNVVVAFFEQSELSNILDTLPPTYYLKLWKQKKIKKYLLIRMKISGLNLAVTEEGEISRKGVEQVNKQTSVSDENETLYLLKDAKIIGTASYKRTRADSLNRILHQFVMRQELLSRTSTKLFSFDDVINYAASGLQCTKLLYLKNNVSLESFIEHKNNEPDNND